MAETKIEWTITVGPDGNRYPGFTFNHVIGCQRVTAGCEKCYAESFAKRYGKAVWGPSGTRVKTSAQYWKQPAKWNAMAGRLDVRLKVFCASLADVFEDWDGPIHASTGIELLINPDTGEIAGDVGRRATSYSFRPLSLKDIRKRLFQIIDETPNLDWLLLTKRPENIERMIPRRAIPGNRMDSVQCVKERDNVWLGTSVSNQATADKMLPALMQSHYLAKHLFVSYEPALGPVDFTGLLRCAECRVCDGDEHPEAYAVRNDLSRQSHPMCGHGRACPFITWGICGGESGAGARPFQVDWARSFVEQFHQAKVPAFVKQMGSMPILPMDTKQQHIDKTAEIYRWPEGTISGNKTKDTSLNGRVLYLKDSKGGNAEEWPEDLRVREWPADSIEKANV